MYTLYAIHTYVLAISCFLHETTADYDVVEMVSMEENPAYVDVHITKKRENNYSPNVLSAV